MHGSLALHEGVLFVGRHQRTAHVQSFDLDGRPLSTGFSFRDAEVGRSAASGLAVDPDRRIWVADGAAQRVRSFNVFGNELAGLILPELPPRRGSGLRAEDRAGRLGAPSDLSALDSGGVLGGQEGDPLLLVVSSGTRRHAAQLFRVEDGAFVESLRPLGDAQGQFRGLQGCASQGDWIWTCEPELGRVQVFRRGEFHFSFALPSGRNGTLQPVAVAPAPGDRLVLLTGGEFPALWLADSAGRLRASLADEAGLVGAEDLVVSPADTDRETRVAVLDRDGDRVQVFSLEGRCFGAFETVRAPEV